MLMAVIKANRAIDTARKDILDEEVSVAAVTQAGFSRDGQRMAISVPVPQHKAVKPMRAAIHRYEATHQLMGTEFTLVAYGDDPQYLTAVGNEVLRDRPARGPDELYKPKSELPLSTDSGLTKRLCGPKLLSC